MCFRKEKYEKRKGDSDSHAILFKGRHQKDNKQESLMSGDKNPETVNVSGFVRPLLAENLSVIKETTGNSADIVIRKLKRALTRKSK